MRSTRWYSNVNQQIVIATICVGVVALLAIDQIKNQILFPHETSGSFPQRLVEAINMPMATLISALSILLLIGLGRLDPKQPAGLWTVRSAISILVILNVSMWAIAAWLR